MTFVAHSRVLPSVLWRPAIFIFVVAQILLALAPIVEGRQGGSARAHVEEAGTRLHHAHDEAKCVACIGRSLLASADLVSREIGRVTYPAFAPLTATAAVGESTPPSQSRPRAPPVAAR